MTLVRGSRDRLKLDWTRDHTAVGPDGRVYMIQSEHVRREPRAYWAMLPTGELAGCPYGYEPTLADAKRACEWAAWVRAGRPSS